MRSGNRVVWLSATLIVLCLFRKKIWNVIDKHNSRISSDVVKSGVRHGRSIKSVVPERNITYHTSEYIDTLQPWIRTDPKKEFRILPKYRTPEVICIGVKKCGTGALNMFLRTHPKIKSLKNNAKEAHFFDATVGYKHGLEHYRLLFEKAEVDDVVFEKTPDYFTRPRVPARIADWNKDVKLIVVLCDPVIRTFSDYAWMTTRESEPMKGKMNYTSFEEYVNESIADIDGIKQWDYKTLGYGTFHSFVRSAYNRRTFPLTGLTVGMYAIHLKDWYTHFPFEQIHVIDGEKLISDPGPVFEDVQRFIGIDVNITPKDFHFNKKRGFYYLKNGPPIATKGKHRGTNALKMPEESLSKLTTFFKPYNEELYELLGKRFDWV